MGRRWRGLPWRAGREERDKYNRLVVELRRVTKLLEQQQGSAESGAEALSVRCNERVYVARVRGTQET